MNEILLWIRVWSSEDSSSNNESINLLEIAIELLMKHVDLIIVLILSKFRQMMIKHFNKSVNSSIFSGYKSFSSSLQLSLSIIRNFRRNFSIAASNSSGSLCMCGPELFFTTLQSRALSKSKCNCDSQIWTNPEMNSRKYFSSFFPGKKKLITKQRTKKMENKKCNQ